MKSFIPSDYGPVFQPLLAVDRRRPLDAGQSRIEFQRPLEQLTIEKAFAHARSAGGELLDRQMAGCCLSAVWLIHDFLDEAHAICQEIPTPSGSYWHAIMHRREGDYANAKYWLRRVGQNDVFNLLGKMVAELAAAEVHQRAREKLGRGGAFEPFAFVDLVEAVSKDRRSNAIDLCLDIQQAEWEILFHTCYQQAITG
jgi:hypothetical protein